MSMVGSILVDFKSNQYNNVFSHYKILINNVLRYSHTKDCDYLYSTHLNIGDVVTIEITNPLSTFVTGLSIVRKDYTTDNVGDDRGITSTPIFYTGLTSSGFSYTFTASTISNSYNFEYNVYIQGTRHTYPFNQAVFRIVENNNKLLFGGFFDRYENQDFGALIQLENDLQIDNEFDVNTGFASTGQTYVQEILIRPDNKIFLCGNWQTYNGITTDYTRLILLNSDGTIDNSFLKDNSININFFQDAFNDAVTSDNKLYRMGTDTGFTSIYLFRINSNGLNDPTFVSGIFDRDLGGITLQDDGKILVGGEFTTYSGVSYNNLIRLNTNGSIDNSFVIGTGFSRSVPYSYITKIIVYKNKIYVSGSFENYSGITIGGLIRLNMDGSIDNTFDIGVGFSGSVNPYTGGTRVYNFIITSNEQILVSHEYTTFNGISVPYLIRLNDDGTLDTSFNIGNGFVFRDYNTGTLYNTSPRALLELSDGSFLVGGSFQFYDDYLSGYSVKIDNNGNYLDWK